MKCLKDKSLQVHKLQRSIIMHWNSLFSAKRTSKYLIKTVACKNAMVNFYYTMLFLSQKSITD